jgi:hypothetical protein
VEEKEERSGGKVKGGEMKGAKRESEHMSAMHLLRRRATNAASKDTETEAKITNLCV